jgi:hypothetical protein
MPALCACSFLPRALALLMTCDMLPQGSSPSKGMKRPAAAAAGAISPVPPMKRQQVSQHAAPPRPPIQQQRALVQKPAPLLQLGPPRAPSAAVGPPAPPPFWQPQRPVVTPTQQMQQRMAGGPGPAPAGRAAKPQAPPTCKSVTCSFDRYGLVYPAGIGKCFCDALRRQENDKIKGAPGASLASYLR